jgi:uncharacterized protein (DUF1800 family)
LAVVCAAAIALPALASSDQPAGLTDQQKAVHVLNRLGFGPRPGDVEKVMKVGVDAYIEAQLHPEAIDDAECDKALEPLDTLKMDSRHLMEDYFAGIRRFLDMQRNSGDAADLKMRYGIDVSKSKGDAPKAAPPTPAELAHHDALRCMGELQQAKLIRAVMSERQLNEVMVDFWTNHFNIDMRKNQCRALKVEDDRDVIRPNALGKFRTLLGASAHSPAMLQYLDNAENSVTRERSAIEKKMIDAYVKQKLGLPAAGIVADKEGPNENYGREILELHTLGVDGGYTQKDVQEVARCFSGWGVSGSKGTFEFRAVRHDKGEKTVLGQTIAAGGGMEDGEKVLDILASHPSTAHFISRKLCQRFVADEPPSDLVERVAKVFLSTDGDIREVVKAILTSPEFFSTAALRSKIKSPFEFAVSAVRAVRGGFVDISGPWEKARFTVLGASELGYGADNLSAQKRKPLAWTVHEMGEPLMAFAAPTGYPELSSKWVSPGALIDRLNFAMALTEQNVLDVRFDTAKLLNGVDTDQPTAVFDRLSDLLLHGQMTDSTRQTLMKRALPQEPGATVDVAKVTALILGSPEFQRR